MSALAEALVAAQAELPLSLRRDADGQIGERGYRYVTFDARERELAAARAWEQRTLAAELDAGHIGGAP